MAVCEWVADLFGWLVHWPWRPARGARPGVLTLGAVLLIIVLEVI